MVEDPPATENSKSSLSEKIIEGEKLINIENVVTVVELASFILDLQ